MKPEFMGSLIVFMAAAFISLIFSFKYLGISFFLLSIWALGIYSDVFPFVAGIFLAAYLSKNSLAIKTPLAILAILLGIYLLGYAIPDKHYSWFKYLNYLKVEGGKIEIILHSIGASLIIFSIMTNSKIYAFLNNRLCNYLGVFSFPLYLVHTLVICSFISFVYLLLSHQAYSRDLVLTVLFGLTFGASILAAVPLVIFDRFWLDLVSKFFKKALR